ncbi:hypothetical protein GFS60_06815 (plasmid) [Rhodococcus sp. WAY2]|nr:hypothetical protein GFS60_06815 [Rhodococcus sp. WAY2]
MNRLTSPDFRNLPVAELRVVALLTSKVSVDTLRAEVLAVRAVDFMLPPPSVGPG